MTQTVGPAIWIGFNLLIIALLMLDLLVFHKEAHEVSMREAALFSAFWVAVGLAFAGVLYIWQGSSASVTYLTGYVIEKSLSVDNLFVFVVVFSYFGVPRAYQHRVLFWGIIGVLIMRGLMIFAGAALLARFDWLTYIFGAFLIFTGVRMAFHEEANVHPEKNAAVRIARKILPVTAEYHDARLIVRDAGRLMATPLLLVLIVVETTDLVFALDSIPAIFAITRDTFLVYTSNVFAILGLRSLYFLLAGVVHKFRFLKYGLSVVLVYVGLKMALHSYLHIPIPISLAVIAIVIGGSVALSMLIPARRPTNCHACKALLDDERDECPECGVIVWPLEAVPGAVSAGDGSQAEDPEPGP